MRKLFFSCVFLCVVLQGELAVLLEAKWPTLMDRARWGFTPRPSSQPCRSTWLPLTLSWEGRWRTWYRAAPNFILRQIYHVLSLHVFCFFYTPRLQDVPPGRASSHWESRVLRDSIMAAVLEDSTAVRIDPATLAALQDTGWYTVNLSRAQSLVWGDGKWRWSQIKFKHIIHLISAWSLAWPQKILQT